jgi:hypothetical protein
MRKKKTSHIRGGRGYMEEKLRVAMFGQKRLSREGGIEIVVKVCSVRRKFYAAGGK